MEPFEFNDINISFVAQKPNPFISSGEVTRFMAMVNGCETI